MSTTLNYRSGVDLPEWRSLSIPMINNTTTPLANAGIAMAPDMRGNGYAHPHCYFNNSGVMCSYNYVTDAWNYIASIGIGGSNSQGSSAVFCPMYSPSGFIAAGATTTSFTVSTALPNNVNPNQLANRGDGKGFIVRIIGYASGKIEERRVIANSGITTTPIIYLDKPLSFTPALNDRYEFLSGSVLFLNTGTSVTANLFRRFDVLTNTMVSTSLITTGLPTIATTHNQLIALDEQYVPWDRNPGEGQIVGTATYDTGGDFTKKCLSATAVPAANQITGQATGGDAEVVLNQYRNYQIRIVEDLTNTTAVGQRRRITGNTAGPSAIYTLAANWTVNPSSSCKFVIENDTDRIIGFFGGQTSTYNYYISNLNNTPGAVTNTWDTTSWAARSVSLAAGGLTWHAFGIKANGGNTLKSSQIISFRGSGSTTYDIFDISGAATGSWPGGATGYFALGVGNSGADAFVGSNDFYHFAYNPHTQDGKMVYMALGTNLNYSTQRQYFAIDSASGMTYRIAGPKVLQGSTTIGSSNASFCSVFQDGTTKIAFYNTPRIMSSSDYYQLMLTF